jgi:hypothetical protein
MDAVCNKLVIEYKKPEKLKKQQLPPKENLINQRSPQKININNLTTGVYFIKIYANKKVYIQRVFIANN